MAKEKPDSRKLVETVVGTVPDDSAANVIEEAVKTGEVDPSQPIVLNANDANFIANELRAVRGEVELNQVVDKAMARKSATAAERARRQQHPSRLIASLRLTDPPGKRTCRRCAYRVDISKMCPNNELCDICYE